MVFTSHKVVWSYLVRIVVRVESRKFLTSRGYQSPVIWQLMNTCFCCPQPVRQSTFTFSLNSHYTWNVWLTYLFISVSQVSVTCEHKTARLTCPTNQNIHIVSVNFGRTDSITCPQPPIVNTQCYSGPAAAGVVKKSCEGRNSCSVVASNSNMQGDPCQGTFKFLSIVYYCA